MFDAVESVPHADAIMFPREKTETMDALWYRRDCITLRGKAITLKKDDFVPGKPDASPPSASAPVPAPSPVPLPPSSGPATVSAEVTRRRSRSIAQAANERMTKLPLLALILALLGCGASWGASCTKDSDCSAGLECIESFADHGSAAGGCQSSGKFCGENLTGIDERAPRRSRRPAGGPALGLFRAFTRVGRNKV